jgi:hypothetical protein
MSLPQNVRNLLYKTLTTITIKIKSLLIIKVHIMSNLLYTIAVILVLFSIGFFAYSAGSIIHILLVICNSYII